MTTELARGAVSGTTNPAATGEGAGADSQLRGRLIMVGWASLVLSLVRWGVDRVRLPFDSQYRAVIGLMWPTADLGLGMVQLAFRILDFLCLALPLALVVGALLHPRVRANPPLPLRLAYELAFILPLLSFVGSGLSRLVSNFIYEGAAWVSRDFTPVLARLEGGVLVRFQATFVSDSLSRASGVAYSCGWMVSLMMAVPILIAAGRPRAASHVIVGWIFAAVLAIPLFLFLPVNEPWAVNPLYGYGGAAGTGVRFLVAGDPTIDLTAISTGLRWATGCCLPSLHVAMPALVSRIAYRDGARWIGRGYAAVAGITAFTVVYLGRHWLVDVLAAVPFAWSVASLVIRWNPDLVPKWPSAVGARPA
jgi:hypothetical protein